MQKHKVDVWLLNTGISGGPYGVGKRMPLPSTRALVSAAIDGTLNKSEFVEVPVFGLQVPTNCPGVDSKLLQPRLSWENTDEYDAKANELRGLFEEKYKKFQ